MRLFIYPSQVGPRLGAELNGKGVDLALAHAHALVANDGLNDQLALDVSAALIPQDMGVFFAMGAAAHVRAQDVLSYVESLSQAGFEALTRQRVTFDLAEQPLLAPIGRDARIFCVGLNYQEHIAEGGPRQADEVPGIFMRTRASFVGHRQEIVMPKLSPQLDWEGEFTAIISKPGRYVSYEKALDHVGGYTITNEGSVRDYQRMTRHLTPGKNFDGSGSMGPWVQTADGIEDPQDVEISTTINGERMQSSNTSDMVFDLCTLVAFISEFCCLQPGDFITTGSPPGVGVHRQPPRWLQVGDVARFQAEGVGVLENRIGGAA